MNDSSASLSVGDGVTGILVREPQPEDVDEVSFAYLSPNESINVGALLLFDLQVYTMSAKIDFTIIVVFFFFFWM